DQALPADAEDPIRTSDAALELEQPERRRLLAQRLLWLFAHPHGGRRGRLFAQERFAAFDRPQESSDQPALAIFWIAPEHRQRLERQEPSPESGRFRRQQLQVAEAPERHPRLADRFSRGGSSRLVKQSECQWYLLLLSCWSLIPTLSLAPSG